MIPGPPYRLDPIRRKQLRRSTASTLNGLDYVDLDVSDETSAEPRREILLTFVKPLNDSLRERFRESGTRCFRIDQGSRINALPVTVAPVPKDGPKNEVLLTVARTGGVQTYTLRLVKPGTDLPLDGIDPILSVVDFTFLTNCVVGADVIDPPPAAPPSPDEPPVNYLAKDYKTFRQLILDRLALTLPQWNEGHVPDLMVTLIELLAYNADYLSYYQDAVATEAYLSTARQRISVRRHARLIDYPMHDGCSARAWICVTVSRDMTLTSRVAFIAGSESDGVVVSRESVEQARGRHVIFQPLGDVPYAFVPQRNEIALFSAGGAAREIPAGATSAVLCGTNNESQLNPGLRLKPGSVLIFEWDCHGNGAERRCRAHPVRLVRVDADPKTDPITGEDIVEVHWSTDDAIADPLPLVADGDTKPAIARGNVVLVDKGETVVEENVTPSVGDGPSLRSWCRLKNSGLVFTAPFPDPSAAAHFQAAVLRGQFFAPPPAPPEAERQTVRDHGRRHHRMRAGMLASARRGVALSDVALRHLKRHSAHLGKDADPVHEALARPLGSAASAMLFEPCDAVAAIRLNETVGGAVWEVRRDLFNSRADDRHFVAEVDDDDVVWLRFGDGEMGAQPDPGTTFTATYRIGQAGTNVGAGRISHVMPISFTDEMAAGNITGVWNPLPSFGGAEPEPIEDVRLYAPSAFRKVRERAVSLGDYAELAQRIPGVAAAAADMDYTGGLSRVRIAVLPRSTLSVDAQQELIEDVSDRLAHFRRIGHAISVVPARHVALAVTLKIQLDGTRHWGAVESDVFDVLSNRRLDSGAMGFFHPDRLRLGQSVSQSDLLALVQAVAGVHAVTVTQLCKLDEKPGGEAPASLIFRQDEVPMLDNDGRYPDRGLLTLDPDKQIGGAQ